MPAAQQETSSAAGELDGDAHAPRVAAVPLARDAHAAIVAAPLVGNASGSLRPPSPPAALVPVVPAGPPSAPPSSASPLQLEAQRPSRTDIVHISHGKIIQYLLQSLTNTIVFQK